MIPAMNLPVRKIGLVLRTNDPRLPGILSRVVPWLRERKVETLLDPASAETRGLSFTPAAERDLASTADVIAVFGGDGTMLHAARLVAGRGTPIVGVNLGSLGFLTEVKLEDLFSMFEALLSGAYHLEDRMMLDVEVLRGPESLGRYWALNDAVINKGAPARIIELEITVNDQLVSLARADGLIVSTPTGSTAYSLSAGGPILYPTLGACVITPICPHTLTNRPVVVPDSAVVQVALTRGSDVMLTVDGQTGLPLEAGDRLLICKSSAVVRLVQPEGNTFFALLREKLKWS
jgi:NAD+ kinase